MEQFGNSQNLIREQNGLRVPEISNLAFLLFCTYLAFNSLAYINWMPPGITSLLLYGFVLVAAFSILVNGTLTISSYTIWYSVVTIVCAFSCSYSVNRGESVSSVVEMIKVLVFTLMAANVIRNETQIKAAMASCSISTTVLFFHLALTGQLEEDERLGQSLMGNANIFATVFMIGAVCSVYLIFFSRRKRWKIFFFAVFAVQTIALALSGGRKYFLLPVVLYASMQMLRTNKRGRKHLISNAILAIAIIWGLWWMVLNVGVLYESLGVRMEALVNAFTGEGETDASTLIRQSMIRLGIELWRESMLVGHGIDAFKTLTHFGVYSHNNYVELLCDTGVIGFLVYYLYLIWLLLKKSRESIPEMYKYYGSLLIAAFLVFDYGAVSYASFLQQMMIQIIVILPGCLRNTK